MIRQPREVEGRARLGKDGARLPDLELVEGAEDDPAWSGRVWLPDRLPVVERLIAMLLEAVGLARPLHLDQANPRPDHVHDPARRWLLEAGTDGHAIRAVAGKQLVQEALGAAFLGPLIPAPPRSELAEPAANLLRGD